MHNEAVACCDGEGRNTTMTYMPMDTRGFLGQTRWAAIHPAETLSASFAAFGRWRLRRRTERMIEALPMDIRKDIGWPDAARTDTSR